MSKRSALVIASLLGASWALDAANDVWQSSLIWIVTMLASGVLCAFLAMREVRIAGPLTVLYLLAVGAADRLTHATLHASDVMAATREALSVLYSGRNPYFHAFLSTIPPYAPFPYLPGELLLYALPDAFFHSIEQVDRVASVVALILLAALMPIIGSARCALCMALLATYQYTTQRAVVGSNDNALTMLLVACAVAMAWSEHARAQRMSRRLDEGCFYASAVLLAWALLFKALSWPFLPFIALYLHARDARRARSYLLVVLGLFVVGVLPFLFPSPMGLIGNVLRAFTFHDYIAGINLWTSLLNLGIPVDPHSPLVPVTALALIGGVFLLCLRLRTATLGGAVLRGAVVVLTGVLVARWSSADYFAFLGGVTAVGAALIEPVLPADS